jgi:hypothetical protein
MFGFQSSYPDKMPIGIPGRIADCGFKNTLSPVCMEAIPSAVAVLKPTYADYSIMLPRNDASIVELSADLITGNIVNATVNTVAIPSVSFGTDHLTTMNAIAAQIRQIPTVAGVVVGGVGNRTLTIVSQPGTPTVVASFVVTAGLTQAVATITPDQGGIFFGVTQSIYNKQNQYIAPVGGGLSITGGVGAPYFPGQVAPTLTLGRIYVVPEDIVTSASSVYYRIAPLGANTQLGSFRGTADGASTAQVTNMKAVWREGNGVVGGIAVLELNLP